MRKLSAILLLSVYLLMQGASLGWYFCRPLSHAWFLMLQQIKFEDRPNSELLIVSIDKDSMAELENEEGEIVIDGILYDIEKIVSKAGKLEVYLEKDEGETKWAAHYCKINQLLHKQTNSKTATTAKAHCFFIVLFFSKQMCQDIAACKGPGIQHQLPREAKYTSPVYGITGPPPKNC